MNRQLPLNTGSTYHVRNIAIDIILTIISFGMFNIWVQYKQMEAVNDMIGRKKYGFLKWAILTLLTFGIYHFIHEYMKSRDIEISLGNEDPAMPVLNLILTVFVLWWVGDAIQQLRINEYFGARGV